MVWICLFVCLISGISPLVDYSMPNPSLLRTRTILFNHDRRDKGLQFSQGYFEATVKHFSQYDPLVTQIPMLEKPLYVLPPVMVK